MNRLQGKRIVITGGTSGIGLAAARRFLDEGARVAVTGTNAERLAQVIGTLGTEVLAIRSDGASVADIVALADRLRTEWGGIDGAFVNAGITLIKPLAELTEADYESIFGINVKGALFATQQFSQLMHDGGAIVLTTSVRNQTGSPGSSVYGGAKAAVRAMARHFAAELLPRGIRVNTVCPGAVNTDIYARAGFNEERTAAIREKVAGMVPMGRAGTPLEIAQAALFLLSDEASYITGEELRVDGGFATF